MGDSLEQLLQQRDWHGANFSGQSLGGLTLSGKIFRGADLSHAHLGGADLRWADLRNANLQNANLGAADLSGADLRYADLRGANLNGTILDGADLRHAQLPPQESKLALPGLELEITEDYQAAESAGYLPMSHWAQAYRLADNNKTLYRNRTAWHLLKSQFGEVVFSDREAYREVRLVKQYKQISQWAYMISRRGFERIASTLGLHLNQKK